MGLKTSSWWPPGNLQLLGKKVYSLTDWWLVAEGCTDGTRNLLLIALVVTRLLWLQFGWKTPNCLQTIFLYTWTVSIYSFKVSLSESLLIADELASLLQPMWDCGNLNLTKAVKKRYAQRVNKECGNSVVTYAEEPTFAGVDYLLSIRFEVQNRSVLWSAPFLEDFSNLAELLLQQLLCCTSCVLGSICIFYKDSANCNFTKIKLCRKYNCPCLWHNFL